MRKQVQMWLGHHSPAFTLATYVHLLPDNLPDPRFFDALTATHATTVPAGALSSYGRCRSRLALTLTGSRTLRDDRAIRNTLAGGEETNGELHRSLRTAIRVRA